MTTRKIGLSVIVAAFLAPAISNAASEKAAFDACVAAFEKSIARPGGAIPAFKAAYRGDRFAGTISQFFATQYTYDLEANSTTAGVIARARCTTDSRGAVSSLSPLPLDARASAIAAQL